jgi:hypothetical protein
MEILDRHSVVNYSAAWVTSLPVSKANVAALPPVAGSRWKIENETFNVMKNHGYELEARRKIPGDDTGRAQPPRLRLALGTRYCRAALAGGAPRCREAIKLLHPHPYLTSYVVFHSWSAILEALTTFTIPTELLQTQKIE